MTDGRDLSAVLSSASIDLDSVGRALGIAPTEGDFESRLNDLAEVALIEISEWLVGKRRFESISQADTWRTIQVYARVRRDAPTVDSLVNDLGIPPGRAQAILSRLRYQDARLLRNMQRRAAAELVRRELPSAPRDSALISLFVDRDAQDCIDEAAWAILRDKEGRAKGGRYELADMPQTKIQRYGAVIDATEPMWEYLANWLESTADAGS